jgi:hypothetical protein
MLLQIMSLLAHTSQLALHLLDSIGHSIVFSLQAAVETPDIMDPCGTRQQPQYAFTPV